jgi:hypothetical protein
MVHRKQIPRHPLQMPNPCLSPYHLPVGRFRRGCDIVKEVRYWSVYSAAATARAVVLLVFATFPKSLCHSEVRGLKDEVREWLWETRKRTVNRQLAVSNNLLDLSLLLQIGKTSPREGTIDL